MSSDTQKNSIEPALYREIFGSFPMTVSVVTAVDSEGTLRGLTTNSVCAVSVEPPLLQVAVGGASNTLRALFGARGFVVNFLSGNAVNVSRRFAQRTQDKFAGVEWEPSAIAAGAPILHEHAVAYAECTTVDAREVGDHWLFTGRIDGGTVFGREALLYRQGLFGSWRGSDEST